MPSRRAPTEELLNCASSHSAPTIIRPSASSRRCWPRSSCSLSRRSRPPSDVLGASTLSTRCDGVSVRTRASTNSTRKAVLPSGVQVNAVKKVTGGSWRVRCAGRTYTGNTWYRINNVNGRSASSRYGVSYVYSATALLRPVTAYPKYTACDGVALRAKPTINSTREAVLPVAVKVSAVARVSGGGGLSRAMASRRLGLPGTGLRS